MELQGMVAVGSQGSSQARGATACVCQPQGGKAISQGSIGAATTAALAGAIEEQKKKEEDEARNR